jgi:phage protein U
MIYALGKFKFQSETPAEALSLTTNYNISTESRINNYAALYAAKKETQNITITGKTLPLQGAGNSALEELYKMASKQISYTLVTGTGKVLGRFAIATIQDNRSTLCSNGAFLVQDFIITLTRDF